MLELDLGISLPSSPGLVPTGWLTDWANRCTQLRQDKLI